jgi:hypothetical protein
MRLHIIIFSICLWGCNSKEQNNLKNNKGRFPVNEDSIARVDSLKWIYYSMNFYGKALFYDSISKEEVKLDPVECNVVLDEYRKVTNDSTYYIFSFNKPGYSFLYVNVPAMDGVGVYKNKIFPIIWHARYGYQNNQDSINSHLTKADSAFRAYLKKYSGKISPWLKQEARRRDVSRELEKSE